jgi:hypothetical protein
MAKRLSSKQQATLAVLETFPPKFDQIHRLIEEIAGLRADESVARRLARMLGEMKAAAGGIGEGALAETLGIMATLARRGGGVQMKVRGLREMFGALRVNFEGAMKAATREEEQEEVDEAEAFGSRPRPSP